MDSKQLHVVFLPFMAHGHMIPIAEMAKLFAGHGAKSTIITTPLNAHLFSSDEHIQTHIINFPSTQAGLPAGCENVSATVNSPNSDDLLFKFLNSMDLFQQPVEDLLHQWRPDCIVADFVFHWATESARRLAIPRLYFNGTGTFAMCLYKCLKEHKPYKTAESDSVPFLLPGGLPHEIRLAKSQLPPHWKDEDLPFTELMDRMDEAEAKSYGTVVNSFRELEPGYLEYFRKVMGRKAWLIGPLSLCNKHETSTAIDGFNSNHECLKWLDSKQPNSVLYISFGSEAAISKAQSAEIAAALEESGQSFIWVVRDDEKKEDWLLPEGLVIRGWAPQRRILGHRSIGGFVTHCGWNSTLESVASGVPMVTWPMQSEQFVNEKLVVEVLRVGVGVGDMEWSGNERRRRVVGKEEIKRAMRKVMVGAEGEEMRRRVVELGEMAAMAIGDGGSSRCDFESLVEELMAVRDGKKGGDGLGKAEE